MVGGNNEFPLECPLAKLGRRSPPSYQEAPHNIMYSRSRHEAPDPSKHHRASLESILRQNNTFERYHTSSNQSSHRRFDDRSINHQCNNYIVDQIDQLGRSSPSFDQGYHTLVSPSPGPSTPRPWIENGIFKGKTRPIYRNNYFALLPDNVILKIFSWLTTVDLCLCAQVCHRFHNIVWTPSMWKCILLKGSISGDKALRTIFIKLSPNLNDSIASTSSAATIDLCSTIERIFVSDGARLTDKGLIMLARRAPELTHLQIQGCAQITNTALAEFISRAHNLQHLDVTGKNLNQSCLVMFLSIFYQTARLWLKLGEVSNFLTSPISKY